MSSCKAGRVLQGRPVVRALARASRISERLADGIATTISSTETPRFRSSAMMLAASLPHPCTKDVGAFVCPVVIKKTHYSYTPGRMLPNLPQQIDSARSSTIDQDTFANRGLRSVVIDEFRSHALPHENRLMV